MTHEKVLIVDDIAANRKLLRKILSVIKPYEVIEAENGEEAVALFKEEQPDLILMDINMPGMDGREAATAIKAEKDGGYVPIIFVTAMSAKDSLVSALASGGDDFISKPFEADVLKSKINAHLRIRELYQQLNKKNKELSIHNQHLSHEQELIEHFFENALQKSYLNNEVIQYHMSSMSVFNGDLFLVSRAPEGGMYLLMGDFTGHGLTAAMGTLPVAMIFFKTTSKGLGVEDIARELNRQLNDLLPTGMFFAATLLELNASADVISVWMGGMPECYWLSKSGEFKSLINSQHMPLGILKDHEFDASVDILRMDKGDKVYIYTDGVIEAQNPKGEMFANDKLESVLTTHGDDRFEKVLTELNNFIGDVDQNDDITFVELTCTDLPVEDNTAYKNTANASPLPWQVSVPVSADEMRAHDPVSKLSSMLGSMPSMAKHKGALHILLSEMYANALDYSILGLDSMTKTDEEHFADFYREREEQLNSLENASIDFNFVYSPTAEKASLQIKMTDSGKGFKGNVIQESDESLHGRGLAIIGSFCEDISFSNDGRTLEAKYPL